MTTKHSSIHLASEGSFDTTSTDSLAEMRSLVAEYQQDPNGAVLDDWEPREGTIITEVRAISARINQNFDAWPSDELKAAHHTFVGKPVFINHNNHDPDRARGRVVASRYVDAGEHDRYVQVLQEVEASRFPMLAKELMEGGLDSVSMGAEAREVECSYCANISTSPWDACEHIPMKGSYLQRRTANGTPEDVLVYEICRKIGFFELSYVFDPADETAVASNVLVANRRQAVSEVEVPPKVDTLHPEEDEKSEDDWQEFVDDPNVIDTIDVLDEPDLGLNQQLERDDDDLPEGFEEFENIDEEIEENEQAEKELAQDARQNAQDKEEAEAEEAQEQFEQEEADKEADPEDDEDWEEEEDGAGGKTSRFKGGSVEAMVADDYGTFNMWVEKNGSLIASDSYANFREAKSAAVVAIKKNMEGKKMSRTAKSRAFRRVTADAWDDAVNAEIAGGGFSFVNTPGDGPSSGYMVSVADEAKFSLDPASNPDDVRGFMQANSNLLNQPNHYVGGWVEQGKLVMDVSINVADKDEAIRIGLENNQDGIFDLNTGQTIYLDQYRTSRRKVAMDIWTDDICSDCLMILANDDDSGMSAQQAAASRAGIAEWRAKGVQPVPGDFVDPSFGTHRCTICETSVAGDRVPANFIEGRKASRRVTAQHYGLNELLGLSTPHPQDPNTKTVTVTLSEGDTAYLPGTTKGAIAGTGDITYYIQPMGTNYEAQGDFRQVPMPAGYFANRKASTADIIERMIQDGDLSPAARNMDPEDVAYQYNESNALEPGDADYLKFSNRKQSSEESIRKWLVNEVRNFAIQKSLAESLWSESPDGATAEDWSDYLDGAGHPELAEKILQDLGGTTASRNGGRRSSHMKNRATSLRSNRMAPQRRRRIGDTNKQTPLLEDTGIAQTPPEEPAVDPESGGDAPNNSESDRVKSARRALAREMARERAIQARRRKQAYNGWSNWDTWNASLWLNNDQGLYNEALGKSASELRALVEDFGVTGDGFDVNAVNWDEVAEGFNDEAHYARRRPARRRQAAPVGADLSGANVNREDLFEDFPATNMTASRVRNRFANWVQENYGSSLRQASGPGELRSWARAFAKESGLALPALHTAIKRDVQALRTAEDKDDLPDFIEDKIDSDEDNPSKEDAKKAALRRRRAAQARNARGRVRTQTTRRRTADDKLDLAAPDDRVNVEKPTSGTTDADAQASQFDKSDFDNNSGKGLENPDTTGTPGIPGGPSVNDLKKTSRATGLQAVRLAEAMITAGLIEDSNESKYKAAAQFEQMSRDIVLDRTALLEKVATVHAKRPSNQKSAGNRGASLNSAVPPNMSGATRPPAPQTREAASDNDSDLFI